MSNLDEENEKRVVEDVDVGWRVWRKRRYYVFFLTFLGFFNLYALRTNLSVAIVPMTSPIKIFNNNVTIIKEPEFNWDSKTQGVILSSFYYGFISTQVLGGYWGTKYGGRIVLGGSLTITSLFTLLTPFFAKSIYLLVIARIIEGLAEAVFYPCFQEIVSKWSPPSERNRMVTSAMSGSTLGTVFSMQFCAILSQNFGWRAIFYVFGSIGMSWSVLWLLTVASKPEEDTRITKKELTFITESLRNVPVCRDLKVPWRQIFRSVPVWAIAISQTTNIWGIYTLLTELPKFMNEVLKFKLSTVGFFSAMPYLTMAITLQISGRLSDYLLIRNILTTLQVRKIFNCCAFILAAVFLLGAAFLRTPVWTVMCLTLAVGFSGFSQIGYAVNILDIAPSYSSIITGLVTTMSTLPGIISPLLTGYIVTDGTAEQWQYVFIISSVIYLFGSLFYGIFASSELQPWAI